jgi:hypothetical protein
MNRLKLSGRQRTQLADRVFRDHRDDTPAAWPEHVGDSHV